MARAEGTLINASNIPRSVSRVYEPFSRIQRPAAERISKGNRLRAPFLAGILCGGKIPRLVCRLGMTILSNRNRTDKEKSYENSLAD